MKEQPGVWNLQKRMIPILVVLCTCFMGAFFFATIMLMFDLNNRIEKGPTIQFSEQQITSVKKLTENNVNVLDEINRFQLEAGSINKRYHQGNVLLMSRIWNSYLGFITGMILAVIGAFFILIKLQEKPTELSGEANSIKFSLLSSSPGIIFGLLGSVLMISTIFNHNQISITDTPLYYYSTNTNDSFRKDPFDIAIPDSLKKSKPMSTNAPPMVKPK